MNFRITTATLCMGLMTAAAFPARAQQSNTQANTQASTQASTQADAQSRRTGFTIRMDTDLVVIDVTATDKTGAYIRDLRPEEVQVFEDGLERKINFFAMNDEAALSRPLAVVFALDLSGSLRPDEMSTLRQADEIHRIDEGRFRILRLNVQSEGENHSGVHSLSGEDRAGL